MKGWIWIQVLAFLVLFLLVATAVFAQIPKDAEKWRRDLTREVRLSWGLNAPVATFASQITAESAFRENPKSSAGAIGMAQFLPSTATWLAGLYRTLGPADPTSPRWAMRALAQYDLHLFNRMPAANDCERMAFALSAYNGGEKFLNRAILACTIAGPIACDPHLWFGNVALVDDGRSHAALLENRGYPEKILHRFEPRYIAAGWGRGVCVA